MIRLAMSPGERDEAVSLSGVASVGEHLFLAPDEGADLLRVTRQDKRGYDGPLTYRSAGQARG